MDSLNVFDHGQETRGVCVGIDLEFMVPSESSGTWRITVPGTRVGGLCHEVHLNTHRDFASASSKGLSKTSNNYCYE